MRPAPPPSSGADIIWQRQRAAFIAAPRLISTVSAGPGDTMPSGCRDVLDTGSRPGRLFQLQPPNSKFISSRGTQARQLHEQAVPLMARVDHAHCAADVGQGQQTAAGRRRATSYGGTSGELRPRNTALRARGFAPCLGVSRLLRVKPTARMRNGAWGSGGRPDAIGSGCSGRRMNC